MKKIPLLLSCLSAIAFISCGKETPQENSSTETENSLQALILQQAPEGAMEVAHIRKTAKEGDSVTIKGKIMGSREPFVDGHAIMLIGDPNKITTCDLNHDDACPTPWDVCCDDPDTIKNSIVSIQAIGDDGNLVKEGFRGLAGIKELTHIVVTGTVANGSTANNMQINASGIYVQP